MTSSLASHQLAVVCGGGGKAELAQFAFDAAEYMAKEALYRMKTYGKYVLPDTSGDLAKAGSATGKLRARLDPGGAIVMVDEDGIPLAGATSSMNRELMSKVLPRR